MIDVSEIFQCTRCGFCCHGETTVSLDKDDQGNMCRELDLPRAEVAEKYWRISGNIIQMKVTDGHCIFYDEGCTVHKGRPWRCGEWPLHPSILEDENNFQTIAESCPGINTKIGYEEFCTALSAILREKKRVKC